MKISQLFVFLTFNLISSGILANPVEIQYNITLSEIKSNGNTDTVSIQKVSIFLKDSAMYITKGHQRTVYDFNKEKIYFLNLISKTYDETSLFAEIDYRQTEFFNRLKLKNFLNKDSIENQLGSLFELESLFGIMAYRDSSAFDLTEASHSNFTNYSLHNRPIIDLAFSPISLNEHTAIFSKYLLYETQIHPLIIKTTISKGHFPEKINYIFSNSGKVYQVRYDLQDFKENPNVAELEHNYFIFGYKTKVNLVTNINKVYGFIHHNAIKFNNKDLVIRTFENYLQKKDYISAFLTISESTLATDNQYETELIKLRLRAEKSQKFQDFIQSLIPPKDANELSEKIEVLKKIQQKNRRKEKGFLINAFIGSYYNGIGYHEEALQSFNKVISQNPYLTSLYIDIGNIYANTHNMRMAWKCYEIALKMNPGHPMVNGILSDKQQLKVFYPDFFM